MPQHSWSEYIRDVQASRRGDPLAIFLRAVLRVASWGYAGVVACRNLAYSAGWKRIHRSMLPVISIGNLTTGGTGKTPTAAWIAQWFRARGIRVCLLSRGYGAAAGQMNDEALVLEQLCPDVPHLQSPNRVEMARVAHEELDSQLLLLDDAFQHRRLHRDLDIVLIDALDPWGGDALLPRGLLREPKRNLKRAGLVLITRVDQVSAATLEILRQQIAHLVQGIPIVEVAFAATNLINAAGETLPLESVHGQTVAAFCGLGHPEAFQKTLGQLGTVVGAFRTFPDHHPYTREDVDDLTAWAASTSAMHVLTSQKDLVKLQLERLGHIPLWAVQISLRVVSNGPALETALEQIALRVSRDEETAG